MHKQEVGGEGEGIGSAAATPRLKIDAVPTNNGSTANATEPNLPGEVRA